MEITFVVTISSDYAFDPQMVRDDIARAIGKAQFVAELDAGVNVAEGEQTEGGAS